MKTDEELDEIADNIQGHREHGLYLAARMELEEIIREALEKGRNDGLNRAIELVSLLSCGTTNQDRADALDDAKQAIRGAFYIPPHEGKDNPHQDRDYNE